MGLSVFLNQLGALFDQHLGFFTMILLVFSRLLAFLYTCPVFNRKEIPFIVRVATAMLMSVMLTHLVPMAHRAHFATDIAGGIFVLQLIMNILIGALIGFVGDMILQAVLAAGAFMNTQIGLSSAMIFDPSTRKQVFILESLFSFIATIIFLEAGGAYWLISAFQRSLEVFPIYQVQTPLFQAMDIGYVISLSSNTLLIGFLLVGPVVVVTLSIDVMLGIVNRTAQQIPVFQLSFATKPVVGLIVMVLTLPIFFDAIARYLKEYHRIF